MTPKQTPTLRTLVAAALAAACLAVPTRARAQAATPPWEKLKIGDFVESIKIGGDMRVRNDALYRTTVKSNDRDRFRLRLRLGAEVQMPNDLSLITRFASGTGEQVSTNQSYDNLGSQKALWIDWAFLRWAPASDQGSFYISSGRMVNAIWRIYASDLLWDEDFNPEGVAEGGEWLFPSAGLTAFVNAQQMVADEDSNTPKNQWVFSEQAGFEAQLPWESRLRLAAAYHKWSDENRSDLSQNVTQNGNRRAGTILANRFGVAEATGQLTTWLGSVPLALQGQIARNVRARNDLPGPRARDGYQAGFILGKAAAAKTWEAAYFAKYAQSDVTVSDVSDSDFGEGGTNRRGHLFWIAYSPTPWLNLKARYFTTKVIDRVISPTSLDSNRLFLDAVVKF